MLTRKYRASFVVGGEALDVSMNFETEGVTVEACDEKAKAELAEHAFSVLKGSKHWVLERQEWTVIPADTGA